MIGNDPAPLALVDLCTQLRDMDGVLAALAVGEMVGHPRAAGLGSFEAVTELPARVGIHLIQLVHLEVPRPGGAVRFRTSDTEPKLKVYLQSRTSPERLDRMETEARALLELD